MNPLLWLNPVGHKAPHSSTHSFPPSGMGERIRRVEVIKPMGWEKNKNSLIIKKINKINQIVMKKNYIFL